MSLADIAQARLSQKMASMEEEQDQIDKIAECMESGAEIARTFFVDEPKEATGAAVAQTARRGVGGALKKLVAPAAVGAAAGGAGYAVGKEEGREEEVREQMKRELLGRIADSFGVPMPMMTQMDETSTY